MQSIQKRIIQYASDLHLEFYKTVNFADILKPAAKHLALAGDICPPSHRLFDDFMKYVSNNWEHVYYIPGNHEYYSTHISKWKYKAPQTMSEIYTNIQHSLKDFHNIYLLGVSKNGTASTLSHYDATNNMAIIGTTLWSHIPEHDTGFIYSNMNDYKYIAIDTKTPLHPFDMNEMHNIEYNALDAEILKWSQLGVSICVITHYVPSYSLITQKYYSSPLNTGFASKSDALIRPCVNTWIFGHTHDTANKLLGETMCVANPLGYSNDSVSTYKSNATIEISKYTPIKSSNVIEDIEFV
jgi:predicted phosphodiesterase